MGGLQEPASSQQVARKPPGASWKLNLMCIMARGPVSTFQITGEICRLSTYWCGRLVEGFLEISEIPEIGFKLKVQGQFLRIRAEQIRRELVWRRDSLKGIGLPIKTLAFSLRVNLHLYGYSVCKTAVSRYWILSVHFTGWLLGSWIASVFLFLRSPNTSHLKP